MSTFIKIPGVNPPSTRPRVDLIDPALPDSGALYLYDASHAAGSWGSGAASGFSIPNIAAASARQLTGSPLNATFSIAGTQIAAKRSTKKGLHLDPAQEVLTTGNYASFILPAALAEYIWKNPGHSYYMSQWNKYTRLTAGSPGGTPPLTSTIHSGASAYLGSLYSNTTATNTYPTTTNGADKLLGQRKESLSPNAMSISSVGTSGWVGSLPSSSGSVNTLPFMLGYTGAVRSTMIPPALTTYRSYLEDLTVSGRTYAQADAADVAAFTAECLTAGGRYYGDA